MPRLPRPLIVVLAVLAGVAVVGGVTAAAELSYAPRYMQGGAYTASDFTQYCEGIAAIHAGIESTSPHRSRLVASALAPLMARWGVVDTMLLGAIGGLAGVVAGVALHAGLIRGRFAAITAALLVLSFSPLVVIGRSLTYYPAMAASFAFAAAGAALALTRGTAWAVALGAAAVFLAPAVDQRGMLWAGPCGAVVLLGALVGPPGALTGLRGRRILMSLGGMLLRLACFGLVFLAMWRLSEWVWPQSLRSGIVQQMYAQISVVSQRSGGVQTPIGVLVPSCAGVELIWGRTPLSAYPGAVRCLLDLSELQKSVPLVPEAVQDWGRHVNNWPLYALYAVVPFVLRNWRDPRRIAALLLPLVPSALALAGARSEPEVRRLELGFLIFPPLFACGAEAVLAMVRGAVARLAGDRPTVVRRAGWALEGAAVLLVLALVTSVIPTRFGPDWHTRWRFGGDNQPDNMMPVPGRTADTTCYAAIADDHRAGRHGQLRRALAEKYPTGTR